MLKYKVLSVSLFVFSFLISTQSLAQKSDSIVIREIFDMELTQGKSYSNLYDLCTKVGNRLSGSEGAKKAVQWAKQVMDDMDLDTVYLQAFEAPNWKRGTIENAFLLNDGSEKIPLTISALGHSVGTNGKPIIAEVIEIKSWEEMDELGDEKLKGKIVFLNRPGDPKYIDTFHSYGGCVDQRVWGASRAGKYGALAVIARSASVTVHGFAHTGVMVYEDGIEKIPAVAISTEHAEFLSNSIIKNKGAKISLELNCEMQGTAIEHNVIGEIRGSKYPEEIIVVGGHLDSWDVGQGAHDDGAGCVHSMEVLQLFKMMNYRPDRTVRCVLWMNEENGVKGAIKYAEVAKEKGEKHIAAIESDRGGFTPRGFDVAGEDAVKEQAYKKLQEWKELFKPYKLHHFEYGYGGVDINKLKDQGPALFGFVPDSQRYFDHHHTHNDNIEGVNKRELEMGSASIASLVYLLSKYGMTVPF
ncbi:MAG: M20/M25/M40 family metallo-hydrolase [Bacteroidia bacterium]|nr:M20/M25/M40 family metallo-hydrolase [Bacteroidia bacterium]